MKYVEGDILTNDGFTCGYVGFEEKGIVGEVGTGSPPVKPIAKGVIVPGLVNAHTHLGDSFVRIKNIKLPHSVKDLVAPPDGLKHRLLQEATEQEILEGMNRSVQEMMVSGTSCFCDFREGGLKGVSQLKHVLKNMLIRSVVLSRPVEMRYVKDELDVLLGNSDGVGVSSVSDWEYAELEKIACRVKRKKKLFALHVSEVVREDIDLVLDLHPDVLVHMIAASESDLLRVKEEEIPVVLCPRSYAFFNLRSNLELLKKSGVMLLLGTDNAMVNSPDVLEEVRFLHQRTKIFSVQELLAMVTYTPRKALNLDDCIQGLNLRGNFVVLDRESLKQVGLSEE
jgi:cytosine/adenosine deaminase-related metal-dependent hydrolase